MTQAFLPYGRHSIDEGDIAAVTRVLRGDFLTTGPEIPAFEAEFAAAVDAPHAVACSSATAALHMALAGLGVGEGDVCIVPSITFLATANASLYCGADVVFADVDAATGLMTAETLTEALNRAGERARAVLPVHLAGALCDMTGIEAVARKAGLLIVEDSCHALGTVGPDGPAGNCARSDAATFSFHPVKTLAAGEGGMVTTRKPELARATSQLRSHGVERDIAAFTRFDGKAEPWTYEMQALGYNYRMPDINAALGRSQLAKLGLFADRRRHLSQLYREQLAHLAPLVQAPVAQPPVDACRHLMNVAIDFDGAGVTRAELMNRLRSRGIGSQVHYVPVHTQPYYVAIYGEMTLPGAETYYARTLSLPLYPDMADGDVGRVAQALADSLGGP
ncbi:UDP-4-amino-4,6-dideoxy-N-acetyl-beta-L-altrosamine transaminase [Maricaulaceae bacterium NA33B04]|nr:UDP-4-amino-4,6-dideoxy-N-acetyl-beta-L-altrosamine transaminase [Maricaulaceae bacterium NA33B04]